MDKGIRQNNLKMAQSLLSLPEWKWLEGEIQERIKVEFAYMKSHVVVGEYGKASEKGGAIRAYENILSTPRKAVKDNTTYFDLARDYADDMLKRVL